MLKSLPVDAGDTEKCRFDPWLGKIPWRRKQQATVVFLPRKSHGQRCLVDCSLWGQRSQI